jgi:hypothetical protein
MLHMCLTVQTSKVAGPLQGIENASLHTSRSGMRRAARARLKMPWWSRYGTNADAALPQTCANAASPSPPPPSPPASSRPRYSTGPHTRSTPATDAAYALVSPACARGLNE